MRAPFKKTLFVPMKYMKLLINYIDFFIQEYNINNKNSTQYLVTYS